MRATLTLIVLAALGAGAGWAAEPHGSIDFGGTAVRGESGSSKFQEYIEVPRGSFVDRLSLNVLGDTSYVFITLNKPGLADQDSTVRGGEWGVQRFTLSYDQTPHNLSNTAQSYLFPMGSGYYSLPDKLQSDLEATNTAVSTGAAIAANLLAGSPFVPLRVDRRTAALAYEYNPTGTWRFNMGAGSERREGGKALGVSYGHSQIQEVIEPVDYWTHDARAGVEYVGKKLAVSAGYAFSSFTNRTSSLTVDNPFKLNPSNLSSSGGSTPGSAQMSLPPDNHTHSGNLALNASLGRNLRLMLDGAYTGQFQNAYFLPATNNPKILAAARKPTLPQDSYDGKIFTTNAGARLNWRPSDKVSVNARGRYTDVNNKSPELLIEQAPYDSSFSTGTPTALFNPTRLRRSLPIEYAKTNAGGDLYYALGRRASLKLAYDHERMKRHFREARETDEDIYTAALNLRLPSELTLRPSFQYARRVSSHYSSHKVGEEAFPLGEGTALGQFEELRKFDEAGRKRRKGAVRADWDLTESFNAGVDYGITKDVYAPEYGLRSEISEYRSVDGNLAATDRLNLYAAYTWEQLRQETLSRYRSTTYDTAANDWVGAMRDTVNTYDAGAGYVLIPDKLDGDLGFTLSHSQGLQRARNPNNITTASGLATDFPRTKTQTTSARVGLKYRWLKDLSANLRYEYQRYTETDWSQDSLDVYESIWNKSVFLGATQGNYRAHVISVGLSYMF